MGEMITVEYVKCSIDHPPVLDREYLAIDAQLTTSVGVPDQSKDGIA
jgi:hypothetical protein